MSKIEWTNKTWNPITGCRRVSPGCTNCYAATMHRRLQSMNPKYFYGFDKVRTHTSELIRPFTWEEGTRVFVCSMSDLFNSDVPTEFILEIFKIMDATPEITYQILTKRSKRLGQFTEVLESVEVPWGDNIWTGVSVESQRYTSRIDDLLKTDAKIKYLSCEPLLGPLNLRPYLDQLDWVIVGGESGVKSRIRKMELDWARSIMAQCRDADVPFFFKQTGSLNPCVGDHPKCGGKGCHYLDGELHQNYPEVRT